MQEKKKKIKKSRERSFCKEFAISREGGIRDRVFAQAALSTLSSSTIEHLRVRIYPLRLFCLSPDT